jgi:hypothetical protein
MGPFFQEEFNNKDNFIFLLNMMRKSRLGSIWFAFIFLCDFEVFEVVKMVFVLGFFSRSF